MLLSSSASWHSARAPNLNRANRVKENSVKEQTAEQPPCPTSEQHIAQLENQCAKTVVSRHGRLPLPGGASRTFSAHSSEALFFPASFSLANINSV